MASQFKYAGSRKAWFLSSSLLAISLLGWTAPAHAQDDTSAEEQDEDDEVSAQSTSSGEILVTAQRRVQSLADVPLSIQAFDAEDLHTSGVSNLSDLAIVTPGLTPTRVIASFSPYIRGIGTQSPLTGVEPAVATYVDGVYQPASVGNIFSFNNIASIEVLKGPQGTLYGRNATGGVISVNTRLPEYEPSLEGRLSYENYDALTVNLYGTTGIGKNVALDVATHYLNQDDGFGRNLLRNEDYQVQRDVSIRSSLLIEPDAATSIRIIGDYTDIETDLGVGMRPIPDGDDGPYTGISIRDTLAGFPGWAEIEAYSVSGRLDHDFGSVNLRLINAFQKINSYQQFDPSNDPNIPAAREVRTTNVERSISSELQLSSDTSGPVSWVTGLYYLDNRAQYGPVDGFTVTARTPFGQVIVLNTISDQKLQSISAYADATYAVTSNTNLTAGIRYTRDSRRFFFRQGQRQAVQVIGGAPTIVTLPPSPIDQASDTSSDLTYRFVVDHHLTDDIMAYASFSTGFKSGGFPGNSPTNPVLRPETVNAYEVGTRALLANGAIRLSAAGFYYDYTDLQVTIVIANAPLSQNAAAARIYGAELEGEAEITESLHATFGAAWLDSKFSDYPGAQSFVPIPGTILNANGPVFNAAGFDTRLSPPLTLNLGLRYEIPIASGQVALSANYAYNDGYYLYTDNRVHQDAFHVVNARIAWTSKDERWGVAVFGRNLLDETYILSAQAGTTNGDAAYYAEPLRYGAEVSFRF